MKISLVLPSLFPTLIDGALAAAHEAAQGLEHEIIVVSPYEVQHPGVRWVAETAPRGSIAACNLGFRHATGDVIALIADDNRLTPGALKLALAHLTTREAECPTLLLGFPRMVRPGLTVLGSVFGRYYPYFFIARPSTLEKAGGAFDEGFTKHYADPDLGLRVWQAGGRCEFVAGATIEDVASRAGAGEAPDKALGSQEKDFQRFFAQWGGAFTPWGSAQNGINLDVAADLLPLLAGAPATIAAENPRQIRDLRILAALTTMSLHHGVKIGAGRALQALEYLRWLGDLAPDVLNIVVSRGIEVTLARPT